MNDNRLQEALDAFTELQALNNDYPNIDNIIKMIRNRIAEER
ncbi:MAG: hypothetical protein ACI4II_03825 [Acutalibacteraceae bacterium]